MESSILNNLNDEQKAPASIIEGAILVTAGAGSGKTRMLTHRIAHMVKDFDIMPYHILAITFTNKAANEMKSRLERMIDNIDGMWVCTFHAMCSKILRQHADRLGYNSNFTIYGDVEKNRVIKRLLENKSTNINLETFAWHISNAKNNLLSPEEYSKFISDARKCETITRIYNEYQAELLKSNSLDFDDLLVKTYELFVKFPDVLEHYQNKFRFIYVDEFQDTNAAQYELLKLLAKKYGNILAVGDEDQSIYSWRGARVENVKNFVKDFEGCKIFKLEQNYRSTKKIISVANKLIKNNAERIDKNLWTDNAEGEEIEVKQTYNDIEEAEWISEKISDLTRNYGKNYSDFAILMRTNSLSRIIEEKLLTYNIPYKVYGGFKFFERKEIKDTTAYLHLITNPSDNDSALRMLSFPKKGIGEVSIAELIKIADENFVPVMEVIMNSSKYGISGALRQKLENIRDLFELLSSKKDTMSLDDYVDFVIKTVGIKEAIGTKTEEDENKCMNVDDFLKSVSEYADANAGATIDDFLQSITLMRDIDSLDENDDFVSLMTIHASKGLEFDTIFIVGLNDGLFPLSRAINSADPNDLEEERRLMYVAVTRAKKQLFLTRPKIKFNFESKRTDYTMISRFLTEMFDYLKKNNSLSQYDLYGNGFGQSNTYKSNISSNGFDEYIELNEKKESLDQRMSSRINIVDVSKSSNTQISQTSSTSKPSPIDYAKYKKGTRVMHNHFGEGTITVGVTDFTSAFVTINFDKVGIKTLSLKYANLNIIDDAN